jgi:pimeloyl-ACP methyl ester carboxylesterase
VPRHILADGVGLHFERRGEGRPVLLLHGLGSGSHDWADSFPILEGSRTVVAPDLRGCGRSDVPDGPFEIAQHGRDVVHLLDALGLDRVDVVGYSMGGAVAFELAVNHAARVRSLMVINSAPSFEADTFRLKFEVFVRKTLLTLFGVERLAGVIAKRLFPKPDQQALRDRVTASIRENTVAAYRGQLDGLVGWTVADRLESIAVPTLVVAAEFDYSPVEVKEQYTARIKDARLVVVPDTRHGLPLEKPDEFHAILTEWLQERS